MGAETGFPEAGYSRDGQAAASSYGTVLLHSTLSSSRQITTAELGPGFETEPPGDRPGSRACVQPGGNDSGSQQRCRQERATAE